MDAKTIRDNIIARKARLFELQKEIEVVRDELMIWIGKESMIQMLSSPNDAPPKN